MNSNEHKLEAERLLVLAQNSAKDEREGIVMNALVHAILSIRKESAYG